MITEIAIDLDPEFTHSWLDGKLRISLDGENVVIQANKEKHGDPYILAEVGTEDFVNGLRVLGVIP
jgi:hypothetical protein